MGGGLDIGAQVLAGAVTLHVHAVAPQLTFANVINLAGVSDINRLSVLTVKFFQFGCIKFFHVQLP